MQKSNIELELEWIGAFKTGLEKIGKKGLLADSDYRMVFYQDLYRDGVNVVSCFSGLYGAEVAKS